MQTLRSLVHKRPDTDMKIRVFFCGLFDIYAFMAIGNIETFMRGGGGWWWGDH